MSRDTYPSGADVLAVLQTNEMWPSSAPLQTLITEQADIAVADSIAAFENSVGWLPYLSNGIATDVRYYDRINRAGHVLLDCGLLTFTSVNIHGSPFLLNNGCWLKPANAPGQGRPYLRLDFLPWLYRSWSWPIPNAIAITGEWGCTRTVPDNVWNAVARHAAAAVITGIQTSPYVASTEQEDFKETFTVSGDFRPMDTVKRWEEGLASVIEKNKFVAA